MALDIALRLSVAVLLGCVVALRYAALGLTLSHYDARGHLVVSRRIIDSITPGWQQVGAVWLPLPHLLNALPAQVDWLYRSGASAVALSIASFAVATAAIAYPGWPFLVAAWRAAGNRGVVVLPTGTGKTHLANMAIDRAKRDNPAAWRRPGTGAVRSGQHMRSE